jgi:hypothetical protein
VYTPIIKVDEKTGAFAFDVNNIAYCRVKSIYGNHRIFPVSELSVVGRDDLLNLADVPVIMLFKNIEKMVEVIKRTPKEGYKNVNEYFDTCKDLIEFTHKLYFGYSNKSDITFDIIKGYNSTKTTWTFGICYDTDDNIAKTFTLPRAINSHTKEVYDKFTELRIDSISKDEYGNDKLNISLNGESIEIISESVRVRLEIVDIYEE